MKKNVHGMCGNDMANKQSFSNSKTHNLQHKLFKIILLTVPGGGSWSDSRCSLSAASSKTLFSKNIKIKKGNEN